MRPAHLCAAERRLAGLVNAFAMGVDAPLAAPNPKGYVMRLTEDQIDRRVDQMLDRLDAQLASGAITQEEYDRETHAIDAWAIAATRGEEMDR